MRSCWWAGVRTTPALALAVSGESSGITQTWSTVWSELLLLQVVLLLHRGSMWAVPQRKVQDFTPCVVLQNKYFHCQQLATCYMLRT